MSRPSNALQECLFQGSPYRCLCRNLTSTVNVSRSRNSLPTSQTPSSSVWPLRLSRPIKDTASLVIPKALCCVPYQTLSNLPRRALLPCARFLMFTAMVHTHRSTRRTFHSSAFHRRCKVPDGFTALKLPRPSGKRSARKKVDDIFLPSIFFFLMSIHFIRPDAVHDPAATDPNSVMPNPECRLSLLRSSRISSIVSRNFHSVPLRCCQRT